jgi:hypothetical protein
LYGVLLTGRGCFRGDKSIFWLSYRTGESEYISDLVSKFAPGLVLGVPVLGDMYVNRFFEGVDGALVFTAVIGGVMLRTVSNRIAAELRVLNDGGSACGISLWNNSDRSKWVNVLFACSSEIRGQHRVPLELG